MTYRSTSKLAGLIAIAALLLPLPRLLATDCACPKPKVKISAIHTITPTDAIEVSLGGAVVAPNAEPVAMERDKEYTLAITVTRKSGFSIGCNPAVNLTFPYCGIEYSRDNGSTWTKGTRTWITVYDNETSFTYTPASILIRITASASDSAMSSPALGDEANPQSTPPAYSYDGTDTPVQTPPGLGLEIPMGTVLTPEGYRSAGVLANYGTLSHASAAPSNLHYNAISALSSMDVEYAVVNGNDIEEKHYVTAQGVVRVRGWDSTNQSKPDWSSAPETLVEVYEPGNYDPVYRDVDETHGFSGVPHSYYRLEIATGYGLADGFRLVQSNHGKVKIRSFQASADGLVLRDMKGARVTESIAIPPSENSTAWQTQTTVTEGGVVISSITEEYKRQGARYLAVSRNEEPIGTTYTSYYDDGRVRSVSRPDGSWSFHDYSQTNSNGSETVTYSPWQSSSSLVYDSDVWSRPQSGMAVKSVSIEEVNGSSSHANLVDLSNTGTGIPMSGSSNSKSPGSVLTLTTHLVERGTSDNISSYSLAYADTIEDRFLAGRTRMTWEATGKATLYQYEKGTWASSSFTPASNGTAVRASAITGYIETPTASSTPDDFTAVPAHSTKEVTITAAEGVVREETHVCNGSNGFSLALAKDHEYEADGQRRHTGVKINGVHVSKTEYVSPNITRALDQDGTITETETNASGDVIRTTTFGNAAVPAVTTTYRRSGLTTTTTVKGHVVSIETRDTAGRIISSQDASGAVVGTAYAAGGRIVTRTKPSGATIDNGVTIVNETHYDGQAVSITGSGVIPQYFDYSVDSSGQVTTTTTVGPETVKDDENQDIPNPRITSVTTNRDGSTALETSPDPAGGSQPIFRTYHYASGSAALLWVSSSASNTAVQVQFNPAASAEAAMGHYTLSGSKTTSGDPVIASTDRLTETSISFVPGVDVWNRETVTRVFHTNGLEDSYTRTTLEALAPVSIDQGLRWVTSTSNGTTIVTTTSDSFFNDHKSVVSTDDSATTASPDSVSVSNHGRTISNSAYGDPTPETMAYDASGRLIRHMSATGAVTTYAYNSAGQLVTATDHVGKATCYTYHPANDKAAGLLWTSTNPKNEVTETLYNSRGQVVEMRGNGTYHVTYHYNDYGEKYEMYTYRTPGDGDLTKWKHAAATGHLLEKTDASNHTTTYTYYSSGLLATRLWARPGAITTTYTHNAFGDLTNVTYSDSTPAVTITPDRLGRPSQIEDASGLRTQTYHPDTGGLDLVAYTDSGLLASREVNYTWDTSLRPSGYEVSGGGPISQLTYDSAGRLYTVSSYGITHTHGYTAGTGTLSSLTATSGSSLILTRTLYHDRMQRLFGIVTTNASGTHLSRHGYTFDDVGRRVRATRENGQRWDYGYDDVGQVTSGVKKFPNATAIPGHSFAYQYDGIGNRSSATHGGTDTDVTYTPNPLNQYSNITTEGGRFILGEAPLTNDVIINGDTNTPAARAGGLGFYWKQITGDNSAGPLWSNDSVASDGVTITGNTWTPPVSVVPVHDFDGNLTYDGRWDSVWDAENRLIRMQTTGIAAAAGVPRQRLDFVYDSRNRRVSKTVSTSNDGTTWTFSSNLRSLYDDWNLIAEYSAPSAESTTVTLQAAHVWGIDLSGTLQGAGGVGGLLASHLFNPGATCFPAYDGNGNVSAWLGASGNLLARMDYSPFGQLVAQYKFTGTGDTTLSRLHFGFSTKYTDAETGFLYYIQRYYNPVTGGWQSKDPIEESGGLNLYGFVWNDGVNNFDYLGMIPKPEAIKWLEQNIEDLRKCTKCCKNIKATLSAIYVELRRQSNIDKNVDKSGWFMYKDHGFKGNSYGPAQIKPSFFEDLIKRRPKDWDKFSKMNSSSKEFRESVLSEIFNNPECIVASAMNEFMDQWNKAKEKDPKIRDISGDPGILATLYNLGFDKSKPKSDPKTGGSTLEIDGKSKTFGEHANDFASSQEMKGLLEKAGCKDETNK